MAIPANLKLRVDIGPPNDGRTVIQSEHACQHASSSPAGSPVAPFQDSVAGPKSTNSWRRSGLTESSAARVSQLQGLRALNLTRVRLLPASPARARKLLSCRCGRTCHRDVETDDAYLRGTALDYLETVLPARIFSLLGPRLALKSTPAPRRRDPAAAPAAPGPSGHDEHCPHQVRRQLAAELDDEG